MRVHEQPEKGGDVRHFFLRVVALAPHDVDAEAAVDEFLLVDVHVGLGGKEHDDVPLCKSLLVDQTADARRDRARLRSLDGRVRPAWLEVLGTRDHQDLHRRSRGIDARRGLEGSRLTWLGAPQWLEPRPEEAVVAEEAVDERQDLRTAAIVDIEPVQTTTLCSRTSRLEPRPALSEYADIGSPEAIDALALVADHDYARSAQALENAALKLVGVLKLVDEHPGARHDRKRAPSGEHQMSRP